jgi:RHS repeat-associated protein
VNGLSTTSYDYDDNGNRIAVTVDGNTTDCATGYDNQDRLLSCAGVTYTYTDNGELATKYNGSDTWTYSYDYDGALLSAVRAGSNPLRIEYVVDGRGRRVARKTGTSPGTMSLERIFVYRDGLRPVAELYPSGALRTLFVYGAGGNVPAYMVQDGVAYRFITDHLGSVRLVVKVADGTVAQRLDYDAFGVVTRNTAPGFQPFGFAGGLYDPDTGLVRFGARDYDAATGRWTAKDPVRFRGGSSNLYTYCGNDPVNWQDPTGRFTLPPNPQGLGPEWSRDSSHRDPNGERWRHPSGDYLDFHKGRPGQYPKKDSNRSRIGGGRDARRISCRDLDGLRVARLEALPEPREAVA